MPFNSAFGKLTFKKVTETFGKRCKASIILIPLRRSYMDTNISNEKANYYLKCFKNDLRLKIKAPIFLLNETR